jgi:mono/diheme cytochrome c family protein
MRYIGAMEKERHPNRWRACMLAALLTFVIVGVSDVATGQKPQKASSSASDEGLIARGKYIVEDVAVCSQCHTPRDSMGKLDRSKWLEGGPLWFEPAEPSDDWPLQAPRIAGNPPGTDAEMIKLLTTGLWRNDKQLRPPMPQFRMNTEDARAVVAYLKSLTPTP